MDAMEDASCDVSIQSHCRNVPTVPKEVTAYLVGFK